MESTGQKIIDNKGIILKFIGREPGVRYRELLRLAGLTNGTLEYHLRMLEAGNKIKVARENGRRARYYPSDILEDESRILGYLRNKASREIILFILENDLCTFQEILKHIDKSKSTLSWHLKRLSEDEIISIVNRLGRQLYRIANEEIVSDILYRYRESLRIMESEQYSEIFEGSLKFESMI